MVDAMSRRPNYGVNVSQTHRDATDDRYKELRRPRKVRFFSNGDRYFKGKKLYITPHRYMSFNDMLSDLTGKLPNSVQLPYGVRQIFTPTGGTRIRDLEQLQDSHDYVCAGFEPFKSVQYGKFDLEPWTNDALGQEMRDPRKQAHPRKHGHFPGYNSEQFPHGAFRPYYNQKLYGGFNPNRHYRHMYPRGRGPQGQVLGGKNFLSQSEDAYNKPKVVTVVRNGDKPRNIVKILLSKRSVQTYEQLMADISESFGPKWKNNRVRKLFTVRGKEVQSISDFFRNDDLFIAVGTEPLTVNDVADILKEVAPDSTRTKNFRKDFEREKQRKADVGELQEGEREDKRDSGFGESESQREDDRDEYIYVPQKHDPVRTRKKKRDSLTDHEKEVVSHLDAEGKKAGEEDRLRTQKRIQKMQDAEKRALDEERRKRGLVPQKGTREDPYKKMLEEREKEREKQREAEKERLRKRREREERRRRLAEERADGDEVDEDEERAHEEAERKRKEERKKRAEEKKRREEERRKEEEREAEEKRKEEEREAVEKRKREEREATEKKKEEERKRAEERKQEERRREAEKVEAERKRKEEERLRRAEEEQKIKGANSARIVEKPPESSAKNKEKVTGTSADAKLKVVGTSAEKNERETVASPKKIEAVKEEEAKDSGVGDEVESTKEAKKQDSSKSRKVVFQDVDSGSPKRRSSKQGVPESGEKQRSKRRDSVKDKENKTEDDANNKGRPEKKENALRKKSTRTKNKLDRQVSNAERVLDKYEVGKVMGDGNFAIVKACKLKNTNNEYAMKVIDKSKLKGKEHMIENEIEIMKRCTHPNIVRLKEEFETKEEIYLIMELVKGGDLFDAITQSVKFTEKDSAHMVRDLCNALYYLHSRHVVHRDLKPENLLVQRTRENTLTLKLADFGLAMDVKEPLFTVCGTPTYVAPEILSEIGYGLEVDMWALGVITYILLCGFPPFRSPDRNQTELFEYIKAGEYEFLSPYWDGISRSAKDLIENLLMVDRLRRYKAIDVLTHPWIVTLANTVDIATNMAEHRLNLRTELEIEAKMAYDAYRLQYHV